MVMTDFLANTFMYLLVGKIYDAFVRVHLDCLGLPLGQPRIHGSWGMGPCTVSSSCVTTGV